MYTIKVTSRILANPTDLSDALLIVIPFYNILPFKANHGVMKERKNPFAFKNWYAVKKV